MNRKTFWLLLVVITLFTVAESYLIWERLTREVVDLEVPAEIVRTVIVKQDKGWCPAKTYDKSGYHLQILSDSTKTPRVDSTFYGKAKITPTGWKEIDQYTLMWADFKPVLTLKQGETYVIHLSDGSNISVWQCGLKLYARWGFG